MKLIKAQKFLDSQEYQSFIGVNSNCPQFQMTIVLIWNWYQFLDRNLNSKVNQLVHQGKFIDLLHYCSLSSRQYLPDSFFLSNFEHHLLFCLLHRIQQNRCLDRTANCTHLLHCFLQFLRTFIRFYNSCLVKIYGYPAQVSHLIHEVFGLS